MDTEMKKVSSKEKLYLSWQKIDKTWRQFYEELYGKSPFWMESTQYGGPWLDKKMNEPI